MLTCVFLAVNYPGSANQPLTDYLLRPSGKYGVAFKDIHWINNTICPDPYFSKKNQKNFSSENKKYCHELMVRIYYPTSIKKGPETPYYQPIIATEQNTLKSIPTVKMKDIEQLSQIKSYTIENAPIVKKKSFPVVLLISGLGGQSQLYENLITQLVSEGYIVLGINSVFINGDIALPNSKVISPKFVDSWDEVSKTIFPVLESDISFVYKKIHHISATDVFRAMDLNHIGGIGHSFGGRALANVANRHTQWFQALITLDMEVHMGSFKPKNTLPPTMHIISAYWRSMFEWQNLNYRLNQNGYLVTLSPNLKNIHYSYHMNFTDLSTLHYLPAYQAFIAYNHFRLSKGEDLIIKNKEETVSELKVSRPLYLIIKKSHSWHIFYYEPGKQAVEISLERIAGLKTALDRLPQTPLNASELIPIKKMIHGYHQNFGNYLGTGNGVEITKALNLYIEGFFNASLKNEKNPFKKCIVLTNNTYMQCGPGIFD
ncbi:TPA: hypothetical protein I8025_000240 [Legionella pneumophila]|nr:hypothetical protein [Legionella pneumophila]HAT2116453.1 hypothetical protein [Legionella pneumophila]